MHDDQGKGNANSAERPTVESATPLYDAFAASYDERFAAPSLRSAYDEIAWELARGLLPPAPATIADMGCGTGRWVSRCQALGHSVIGIEPSAAMQDVLRRKFAGTAFELMDCAVENASIEPGSIDVAFAMGSLQYAEDPARTLSRMASWLRPGGVLCVHVDGLMALTMELMRLGRNDEALKRLDERRGVFTFEGATAPLHLFDAARLAAALRAAGLDRVDTRGLLVAPAIFGRERSEAAVVEDYEAFLARERRLGRTATMSDAGKHVMAWGFAPAD